MVGGVVALMASPGVNGDPTTLAAIGVGAAALVATLWGTIVTPTLGESLHRRLLKNVDQLTELKSQSRRDSWQSVRELVVTYLLDKAKGKVAAGQVKAELASVRQTYEKGARDIRQALNELSTVKHT